jgi:hypothetical protein
MPRAIAKKSNVARMPKSTSGDSTAQALYGFAKELSASLDGIAQELKPHYHIEEVADNLAGIATSLGDLARAVALQTIAQNGNEDDRAKAIENLKNWFDDFKG